MTEIKLYGIPNCDTVKKATSWLDKNKIAFEFYDYKKEAATAAQLKRWCKEKGWETIFNKRSSTWKTLQQEQGTVVTNQAEAIAVMLQNNSIIKRPVVEIAEEILVGFDEKLYIQKLKQQSSKK